MKAFSALGAYGASVITAITAQNTRAVTAVEAVSPALITAQIDAVFDDLPVNAVKIGMLASVPVTEAVAEAELAPAPQLEGDPLPSYAAGSRYVYSDGEVRSVLEVSGQEVRWRSNRGATFVGHANFVIPPISWFSSQERGKRSLSKAQSELWPFGTRPRATAADP